MQVKIYPSSATGTVETNISKSYAHRALICAALASGVSHIRFSKPSKDILVTMECLRGLGAQLIFKENEVIVVGCDPFQTKANQVYCHESGSTLRFLIPVFALASQSFTFTGTPRLLQRPQEVYQSFFAQNGLAFAQNEKAISFMGGIKAGEYRLAGDISSQFFTGLLLALPLLPKDSILHITPPFESRSYVLMTLDVLKEFGVFCQLQENTIYIKGGQHYQPCDYQVEGDYSSSAFFELLGAINQRVTCTNLNPNSTQGDRCFIDFLQQAGAKVSYHQQAYTLEKQPLHPIQIDLADCPDLGPAAMVLGCIAGGIQMKHISRLRYKESDRVEAMQQELAKFGYQVFADENNLTVLKERLPIEKEIIEIDCHNDHRIAMSLAILATICDRAVLLKGAECIDKSYPHFFEDLASVQVKLEVIHD